MFESLLLNQTERKALHTSLGTLWQSAKAILFDFDGVLADSEPFYRKSWNRALSVYGHQIPEHDYWKFWSFLGGGLQGEMARTGLSIPDPLRAHKAQKSIYVDYCSDNAIPLFPYAAETLRIVSRNKICAIASNTDSSLVKTVLLSNNVHSLPPVIGGEGLPSKPAPDIFLRASELLGVSPADCLVFEDALKGIVASEKAGIPSVLVRNRYNSDFALPFPVCEIHGLEELFVFLDELYVQ